MPCQWALCGEAYKWFSLAILHKSTSVNTVENRDLIEKKITPAKIAEAQKLAREWMERFEK